MRTHRNHAVLSIVLVICAGVLACSGCKKEQEEASEPAPASETAPVADVEPVLPTEPDPIDKVKVTAVLAKADALDGAEDKVVAKCLMCACRMAGSPEHTVEYAGYTLHMCSEHCQKFFLENPVSAVLEAPLDGELDEMPGDEDVIDMATDGVMDDMGGAME